MARKKRWWLAIALVVTVSAVVAVGAKTRLANGKAEEKGPAIPTMAAKLADVQVVVREVGTVEPELKVEIKSNLTGRVVDLPHRAGDRVARGDLIARIEPDVNQARDLLTVKNLLDAAIIGYEDAREEYDANRPLYEDGLISRELFRRCETRYRQAQQALQAAREKISVVETSGIPIGDNPRQVVNIAAPMPGIVIHRPVELGETVTGSGSFNAGTVIATVADLGSMIVEAGINEVDIGKIHEGQEVRVTLDAFPRKLFPGTIRRIAPAARLDNLVKVFDVEIALESPGLELRTGMTANIEIRGEERQAVLAVPVESVFVRGDEEIVYVERATPLPAEAPAPDGDGQDAAPSAEAAPQTAEAQTAEAQTPTAEAGAEPTDELPEGWRDDPRQKWRRWFEERRVKTGIASNTEVEIVDGLSEGEKVALADPSRPEEERS